MSLPTFGANHDLVAALAKYGARFMVVGGVATTFHVPERQTHDPGELDLFVAVLGERGRHARSAVGMGTLPMQITVEIEAVMRIHD